MLILLFFIVCTCFAAQQFQIDKHKQSPHFGRGHSTLLIMRIYQICYLMLSNWLPKNRYHLCTNPGQLVVKSRRYCHFRQHLVPLLSSHQNNLFNLRDLIDVFLSGPFKMEQSEKIINFHFVFILTIFLKRRKSYVGFSDHTCL